METAQFIRLPVLARPSSPALLPPAIRTKVPSASPSVRTDCALQPALLSGLVRKPFCLLSQGLFPAEAPPPTPIRAHRQFSYPEPPLLPGQTPAPTPDLSHAPFGGARRPRGPARTQGAAKSRRGGRGRGRMILWRPRSGAAEAAAAPHESEAGPGGRPEPTTSRLPWFALQLPRPAPPYGPPVG